MWTQRKASSNVSKHGVAFEDAIAVFFDPLARIFSDPDHSEGEERELDCHGYDSIDRLLLISFVERRGNVRIVSARRATSNEVKNHEKHIK